MAAGLDDAILRILLLGKTGAGKSTVSNALLGGGKRFCVGRGINSETKCCDWEKAVRKDITIEVTDTPGLCDNDMDESLVYKELAKSVALAKPGPNVILFVLRADCRFTEEERQAYETIKQLFSEKISKYLILVFNGIDGYGWKLPIAEQREAHKKNLVNFRQDSSGSRRAMHKMLVEAGERYIGLNNRTPADVQQAQIQDLVYMMLDLVRKNAGAFYRTEMTEEINRKVDEMIQPKPGRDISKMIVEGDVPVGFFEIIAKIIRRTFQRIDRAISELCSVM